MDKVQLKKFNERRKPVRITSIFGFLEEDCVNLSHRNWIAISGFVWLAVGAFLLYKGLHLIADGVIKADTLCFKMQGLFGSPQQSGTALIAGGLLLGFIKGKLVLSKTVRRVALRISSLPLPIRFSSVYAPSYWILIGSMMALGMILKVFPIPIDIRGFIDTAVGSALINGAMLYFRAARGALRV